MCLFLIKKILEMWVLLAFFNNHFLSLYLEGDFFPPIVVVLPSGKPVFCDFGKCALCSVRNLQYLLGLAAWIATDPCQGKLLRLVTMGGIERDTVGLPGSHPLIRSHSVLGQATLELEPLSQVPVPSGCHLMILC